MVASTAASAGNATWQHGLIQGNPFLTAAWHTTAIRVADHTPSSPRPARNAPWKLAQTATSGGASHKAQDSARVGRVENQQQQQEE